MSPNEAIEEVKALLTKGNTEAAADLLLELSKDSKKEYYHTSLLLKNRIETLQHQVIEGILSQSEQNLEWARVTKSILDLAEQIEKNELPVNPGQLFKGQENRRRPLLITLALLAIPIMAVVGWILLQNDLTSSPPSNSIEAKAIETISYEGRVVRAADLSPVAGAVLNFDHGFLKVQTDAEGKYSVALPAGQKTTYLEIYADGELKINRKILVSREILSELKIPK